MKKFNRLVEEAYAEMYLIEGNQTKQFNSWVKDLTDSERNITSYDIEEENFGYTVIFYCKDIPQLKSNFEYADIDDYLYYINGEKYENSYFINDFKVVDNDSDSVTVSFYDKKQKNKKVVKKSSEPDLKGLLKYVLKTTFKSDHPDEDEWNKTRIYDVNMIDNYLIIGVYMYRDSVGEPQSGARSVMRKLEDSKIVKKFNISNIDIWPKDTPEEVQKYRDSIYEYGEIGTCIAKIT